MTFAFIILLILLAHQSSGASPKGQPLAAQAAHAQVTATVKQTEAKNSPDPQKHKDAAVAQAKADALTKAALSEASAKSAATKTPPPWPQAMPSGLPPFPSGWEPDQPPPQAVQARAWQLLPILWKQGANARKTEQTSGRWITYVSQAMGPKKGVVAFRPRPGAAPAPSSSSPPTNVATYARPLPSGTPTIRQGMSGDAVRRWQAILGVTADGQFGPATAAATRAWQARHGLTADGVVGPATWGAAGGTPV